jgi:hypothetical protein
MALNLFCYSPFSKAKAQSLIDKTKRGHKDLFRKKFTIYAADSMDDQYSFIPSEFNFVANSSFLVLLAEKNAAPELDDVARVLKSEFGEKNLLVLFENESLM